MGKNLLSEAKLKPRSEASRQKINNFPLKRSFASRFKLRFAQQAFNLI